MPLPHNNLDYDTEEQDSKVDFLKNHDLQDRPFPYLCITPYEEVRLTEWGTLLLYGIVIDRNGKVSSIKPK